METNEDAKARAQDTASILVHRRRHAKKADPRNGEVPCGPVHLPDQSRSPQPQSSTYLQFPEPLRSNDIVPPRPTRPPSLFWTNCTETQSARARACCPMSSQHVQRGTTFAAGICGVKRQPEPFEKEGPQQLWLHFELSGRRSAMQNFAGAWA